MSHRSVLVWVACSIGLAGCAQTNYRVELVPDEGKMARRLVISGSPTSEDDSTPSLPREERQRIEGAYPGVLSHNDDGELEISGVFGQEMPDGVGGSGSYLYLESPMGSVSYYSERFRGSFDLTGGMDEAEDGVDSTLGLLMQWAEQTFGQQPEELRFKQWVNETLRQDAKDLMRLVWAHRVASDLGKPPDSKSLEAYLIQFLLEREYLNLEDLPRVARMSHAEDSRAIVAWGASVVFRKLNVEQEIVAGSSLAILSDADALVESLREFLRKTPEYQKLPAVQNDAKDGSVADSDSQPDPLWALGNPILYGLLVANNEDHVNLEVSLRTDVEPFVTNGVFDRESSQTVWETGLHGRLVPMLTYATWARPNEDYQNEKLSKLVLKDQELAEYVLWYNGLTSEERRQWDELFDESDSRDSLKQAISDFEFASQTGLADIPRELMAGW